MQEYIFRSLSENGASTFLKINLHRAKAGINEGVWDGGGQPCLLVFTDNHILLSQCGFQEILSFSNLEWGVWIWATDRVGVFCWRTDFQLPMEIWLLINVLENFRCACVFQGPLKWNQSHHSRPSSCCESHKYSSWWTQWTAVQGLLKTWGEQTFVPHPAFSFLCIQTAQEDVLKADYCCQGNSRLILHSSKLNGSPWGLESVIGDSCLGGWGGCFVLFLSFALSVPSSRESNFKLWRNSQFVNDCRWTEKKRPLGL